MEPDFHCDYGANITVGENFYANFNLVILDDAPVTIGDNVLLAPNVSLYTAGTPSIRTPGTVVMSTGNPLLLRTTYGWAAA